MISVFPIWLDKVTDKNLLNGQLQANEQENPNETKTRLNVNIQSAYVKAVGTTVTYYIYSEK